jgi:Tfp pilus assembly protein PilF
MAEPVYYRGLCLQKLGQNERAKALFQGLVDAAGNAPPPNARISGGSSSGRSQSPRARQAAAHYSAGLGYLGLNERATAKEEKRQAVELSPDLVAARKLLASLE